jgi:hypothetical protein
MFARRRLTMRQMQDGRTDAGWEGTRARQHEKVELAFESSRVAEVQNGQ